MNQREQLCPAHAAACVLLIKQGLVLAVWNAAHGSWGLPGGKREPRAPLLGFETIRETAVRESREELGVDLTKRLVWLFAGEHWPPVARQPDPPREVHLYYAAESTGPQAVETRLEWMSWRDFVLASPAFTAFYREALPDGVGHLRDTVFV